jgi:GGDEF domain-containing protein
VKSLTLRMSPNSEKEFIIVLKSPSNRQAFNLASFIYIKMHNRRLTQNEEEKTEQVEKYLRKKSSHDNEIETVIEE